MLNNKLIIVPTAPAGIMTIFGLPAPKQHCACCVAELKTQMSCMVRTQHVCYDSPCWHGLHKTSHMHESLKPYYSRAPRTISVSQASCSVVIMASAADHLRGRWLTCYDDIWIELPHGGQGLQGCICELDLQVLRVLSQPGLVAPLLPLLCRFCLH